MSESRSAEPAITFDTAIDTPQSGPAFDVGALLQTEAQKSVVRLVTCGSVDDGKSTLIGRLLYDSNLLYEDQIEALRVESKGRLEGHETLDFSLLVDGLQAEREQGITIDVAYRFFSTAKRNVIVADAPGHEQYTRNMATAASNADLAVLLLDARKGVLTQTRRHAMICGLMGVQNFIVAINKMDLVDYDKSVFDEINSDIATLFQEAELPAPCVIPVSALRGDNIVSHSTVIDWYSGPALFEQIEAVPLSRESLSEKPMRLPVQMVNRPKDGFRGYAGTLAAGNLSPGDQVTVARTGLPAVVERLVTPEGDIRTATAGDAVMITLDRELDISRGDMLCAPGAMPEHVEQFQATLLWMSDRPMLAGRTFLLQLGTALVPAQVIALKHRIDIDNLAHEAARELAVNEIGTVTISASAPVTFDIYADNRQTGCFLLIDRETGETRGAGTISYPLHRAANLSDQHYDINREARTALMGHTPSIVWMTGLSGSGKSTIANELVRTLHAQGRHTYVLDGDNVRRHLNRDLGFTEADRVENIRRVAEVARLMADAGLIVMVSFIAPFGRDRALARQIAKEAEITFYEVFVDTPLEECEKRDPKGLYAKARAGKIPNFTGIESPYEAPENADLTIDTVNNTPSQASRLIIDMLSG
jgi:bifunctional enzyme CysN/CysC